MHLRWIKNYFYVANTKKSSIDLVAFVIEFYVTLQTKHYILICSLFGKRRTCQKDSTS